MNWFLGRVLVLKMFKLERGEGESKRGLPAVPTFSHPHFQPTGRLHFLMLQRKVDEEEGLSLDPGQ